MDGLGAYPILDERIIPNSWSLVKKNLSQVQKILDQLLNSISNFYTPVAKSVILVNGISLYWTIHDIE